MNTQSQSNRAPCESQPSWIRCVRSIWTKELLSLVGQRRSRRAGLMQFILMVGFLGIVPHITQSESQMGLLTQQLMTIFVVGVSTAGLAAESLNVERSEATLQVLLSSPARPRWILGAKTLVGLAYGVAMGTLVVALSYLACLFKGSASLWDLRMLALVPAGSLLIALLSTQIGFVVALYVHSIRFAAQLSMLLLGALGGGCYAAWRASGLESQSLAITLGLSLTLLLSMCGFAWARHNFRASKMFG